MDIYVDATTLIALGNVGELELLTNFGGSVVVLESVFDEVTTQPARARLRRICDAGGVDRSSDFDERDQFVLDTKSILADEVNTGDVQIIAHVRYSLHNDRSVGVVSDDRRVRTVSEEWGATVTGTIGVVVRGVHEGMDPDEAKQLVRRLDSRGLHMTGELRETAYRLVDEAAKERDKV